MGEIDRIHHVSGMILPVRHATVQQRSGQPRREHAPGQDQPEDSLEFHEEEPPETEQAPPLPTSDSEGSRLDLSA